MNEYINLTQDNINVEHICCAISDKKHQQGVEIKKEWLKSRMKEGHVFRKLNAQGKVFIEYAPLEKAWIPVQGNNYFYIYCLWVSGSFKGQGHAKNLLEYCIQDAKKKKKSGICILSSKKKAPYLSEKKFLQHYGFEVVDTIDDYELMALSFDGTKPSFMDTAKEMRIKSKKLTIYYSPQCPFTQNCIKEVETVCKENKVALDLIVIDTLEAAKNIPCLFNNWAVFNQGKYETHLMLNANIAKKVLGI